jgi:hypothetical protein
VQSDKASIEITSKYSGTIQKLHHAAGDIVAVRLGRPRTNAACPCPATRARLPTANPLVSCSPPHTHTRVHGPCAGGCHSGGHSGGGWQPGGRQ